MEEYLYHYTAPLRWEQIKEAGFLKLTPSNLKKLVNPKVITLPDGTKSVVDETDSYKPVVWLTNSTSSVNLGLIPEKEKILIVIPFNKEKHHWWVTWKDKNKMDKKQFKNMTSHGERYSSWYVCEEEIPLDEIYMVKNVETDEILYKNDKFEEK
jgi:hypothetical protein